MTINIGGKIRYVHILICTLFYGPKPPDKDEVSHGNSKGTDNRACNLEWSTHLDNMMTTINNGMNKNCKPVRAIYEDGTYKDFISIAEGRKSTGAKDIGKALIGTYMTSGKDDNGNSIKWIAILNKDNELN